MYAETIAERTAMSRILESESESDSGNSSGDSIEDSRLDVAVASVVASSVVGGPGEPAAVYRVQSRLKLFSRRLSQLGLGSDVIEGDVDTEGEDVKSYTVEPDIGVGVSSKKNKNEEASVNAENSNNVGRKADANTSSSIDTKIDASIPQKIQILFQPIGSLPKMNPTVFRISTLQPFAMVILFLVRRLKMDHVYCYINSSFAPSPNQSVGELWNLFNVQGKLIVSYCATIAFG